MTEIRREEHLVLRLARQDQFAVGQASVLERAVDAHLIVLVGQPFLLPLTHTESPALLIIRGHVGNPVGLVGLRIDVFQQLLAAHLLVDGHRIAQHVQIAVLEVNDRLAPHILDPSAPDIPLSRHRPVEHLRSRRHLVNRHLRHLLTDHLQRPSEPVARNTPADREQPPRQRVHPISFVVHIIIICIGQTLAQPSPPE